jgi:hypothetical protein
MTTGRDRGHNGHEKHGQRDPARHTHEGIGARGRNREPGGVVQRNGDPHGGGGGSSCMMQLAQGAAYFVAVAFLVASIVGFIR